MHRRLLVPLLLAVATLASGCLEYEEVIEIRKDGSGTFSLKLALDMSEVYEVLGGPSEGPDEKAVTREELARQFEAPGVKLTRLEVEQTKMGMKIDLAFSFVSIDALDRIPGFAEERHIEVKKRDGGGYDFVYEYDAAKSGEDLGMSERPAGGGEAEEPDEGGEERPKPPPEESIDELAQKMEELMKRLEKKVKFTITVRFPGKVYDADAFETVGDRATWDYSPKANPKKSILGENKKLVMRARFDGAGVTIK